MKSAKETRLTIDEIELHERLVDNLVRQYEVAETERPNNKKELAARQQAIEETRAKIKELRESLAWAETTALN